MVREEFQNLPYGEKTGERISVDELHISLNSLCAAIRDDILHPERIKDKEYGWGYRWFHVPKKEIENLIPLQEAIELVKEKGIVRAKSQIIGLTRNGKIKTVRIGGQRYLQKEQLEKGLSESLFSIAEVDKKPPHFISLTEAVEITGYSKEQINEWVYKRKLRVVKCGKHLFLDRRSIVRYHDKKKSALPDGYITVHQLAKEIKETMPEYDYQEIIRRLHRLTNEGKIDYVVANYDRCVPVETIESFRNASSNLYKELFS